MENVIGLDDVRVEFVLVRTPDGSGKLELIKFHSPADEHGAHPAPANRQGIHHVALVVDDLDAIVKVLLCYVRGPEGNVELAERI